MAVLSLDQLKTLVFEQRAKPDAVSIFMPTFKTGAETKQNPIVLEKLLEKAKTLLMDTVFNRAVDAERYLKPVTRLITDSEVWLHPSDGLAIFLHDNFLEYHSLPLSVSESVSVNYRFNIKPLIPAFGAESRFYVLALSQKAVRLIRCINNETQLIDLKGIVPGSLLEAKTPHRLERGLQFHTGEPARNRNTSVFHGQGPDEIVKDDIKLYFQQINEGLVQKSLRNEVAPLVIAAVEYLHPIYKKANTYQYLFDSGIRGNPEHFTAEDLRTRALSLLRPYFETDKRNALKEYRELDGTGHTVTDIRQIVSSSNFGQVERLLIRVDSHAWGSYDENTNEVKVHDKPESNDLDLIDLAAVNTLSNRGEVYTLKPDEIPSAAIVGAILRHEEHIPKLRHLGDAKTMVKR